VVLAAGLVIALVEPLMFMVRNHPHEIVYFNAIAGGPRGALGRFELDYWAHSFAEAGRWCDRLARHGGLPLIVAGWPRGVTLSELPRHKALQVRPVGAGPITSRFNSCGDRGTRSRPP